MKLPTPSAPFSPVYVHGESITIETEGKVLVLPSGNPNILPLFNEYTLNSNRLSIAESPFGGLKGPGSPDYAPGTVNIIEGDGIYLTDINGQNTSKTLTAGKLKEVNSFTVDTTNHVITEEFIVQNDSAGTEIVVAADTTTISGWSIENGVGELSLDNGVKFTGISTSNALVIRKYIGTVQNGKQFITFKVKSSVNTTLRFAFLSGSANKGWTPRNFPIVANTETKFVLPLLAPVGTTGSNPGADGGWTPADSSTIYFGITTPDNTNQYAMTVSDVNVCNGTWAKVEVAVPDNLSATSLSLYTHNGTAYQLCSSHSLDSAYALVAQTSANCTLLDSTKLDDVYGTGNGRSVFPKGESGETKTGSSGTITYSQNKGTSRRIGLKVSLPPSDGGRTNFNKCRIKTVISYAADSAGKYSASYQFSDTTSASTGLQNLSKSWVALYDPTSNLIDFYLFTHRPKNLEFRRDESGNIYELVLYPGNGLIYHGQITYPDLTLDSDSNLIPNFLEESIEGSLTKFLKSYGMVI
jgi:hypothetical protein